MGKDKALLPYANTVLAERVAREVERAAGSVALVGDPNRYRTLGRRVIPDLRPGNGPLGGIEAALTASTADWNLVVACDLPGVSACLLRRLLDEAENSGADCLAPVSPAGRVEPLCAVYHRRCLPVVTGILNRGIKKVRAMLAGLRVAYWRAPAGDWFENLNTTDDWKQHLATHFPKTARRERKQSP